eukprot:TRINITY_DN41825_c0_g1_i1.p1 TRINITY_DN41825_c0_g1~~TRINITY_DN41825_c0_g1_i1.p1  ORF type:complete len:295 (-),score=60.87 TRINITY_DN41825_c0_g1_i1:228-1076(-)
MKSDHLCLIDLNVVSQNFLGHLQSNFLDDVMSAQALGNIRDFNLYLDNQVDHLNETKHVAKRVGVLAPVSHVTMTLQLLMAHCLGEKYDSLLPMVVKVLHSLFQWVDLVSASDPKYTNVIRLENYHHLYMSLNDLSIPGVDDFRAQAMKHYQDNTAEYLEWIISCQFIKTKDFFDSMTKLQGLVAERDIQYQEEFSRANLKKALKAATDNTAKQLQTIYRRMDKHLCVKEGLLRELWSDLSLFFNSLWQEWIAKVELCYPGEVISLSIDELTAMLNATPESI